MNDTPHFGSLMFSTKTPAVYKVVSYHHKDNGKDENGNPIYGEIWAWGGELMFSGDGLAPRHVQVDLLDQTYLPLVDAVYNLDPYQFASFILVLNRLEEFKKNFNFGSREY